MLVVSDVVLTESQGCRSLVGVIQSQVQLVVSPGPPHLKPQFSSLIGRGLTRLCSHWLDLDLSYYAIKIQLGHTKTQRVISCSTLFYLIIVIASMHGNYPL